MVFNKDNNGIAVLRLSRAAGHTLRLAQHPKSVLGLMWLFQKPKESTGQSTPRAVRRFLVIALFSVSQLHTVS